MALGTTFGDVIEMVRDECRLSSNTSRGIDNLAYIKRLIKRQNEMLAQDYDWRHMTIAEPNGDKTLEAGSRYYDYPATLDPQRITSVWTEEGGTWEELVDGITPADYNLVGRMDPPLKWSRYTEAQFEVWPTPASNGGIVRFVGQRKPTALVNESSRLDMDDILVSLICAAEILAGTKQADAQAKADAAKRRLAQMRAGYADRTRVMVGRASRETIPLTEAFVQSIASRRT